MIDKLPINNEADNLDQWQYNRGWNAAVEAANPLIAHLLNLIDELRYQISKGAATDE